MTDAVADTPRSLAQRRRDALAVLNPDGRIAYQHMGRALDVVLHFNWTLKRAVRACAFHDSRTIFTPPIAGDRAFALLLHEGGHLQDHESRPSVAYHDAVDDLLCAYSFEAELVAWKFALAWGGSLWNATMQDEMSTCLWSYRQAFTDLQTTASRAAMESLLTEGAERARHVMRVSR